MESRTAARLLVMIAGGETYKDIKATDIDTDKKSIATIQSILTGKSAVASEVDKKQTTEKKKDGKMPLRTKETTPTAPVKKTNRPPKTSPP